MFSHFGKVSKCCGTMWRCRNSPKIQSDVFCLWTNAKECGGIAMWCYWIKLKMHQNDKKTKILPCVQNSLKNLCGTVWGYVGLCRLLENIKNRPGLLPVFIFFWHFRCWHCHIISPPPLSGIPGKFKKLHVHRFWHFWGFWIAPHSAAALLSISGKHPTTKFFRIFAFLSILDSAT